METAPSPKKQSVTRPSPRYLTGEGDAGGERDVPADDAVAAEHVVLGVEDVHRAAEPLRAAGDLAEELGQDRFGVHALRDGEAVVAVGGDDVVVGRERRASADGDRLLADVKVEESADFALRVGARALFFEAANEEHLAVAADEALGASIGGGAEVLGVRSGEHVPK